MKRDASAGELAQSHAALAAEVRQRIEEALAGLRFGAVEITVHDGRIVQVERREKYRAVSIAGPLLRVELRNPVGSVPIRVEVQRSLPLASRIAAGQTVFVRPRTSRVFLQ